MTKVIPNLEVSPVPVTIWATKVHQTWALQPFYQHSHLMVIFLSFHEIAPFSGIFFPKKNFFLVESFIWNTRKYIENTSNSIQWYVGRHRNFVTSSSSNEASTSSIAASVTSSDGFAMNEAASRNSHLAHYTNATHVSLTPRGLWVRIRQEVNYIFFFLFSGFWIFS